MTTQPGARHVAALLAANIAAAAWIVSVWLGFDPLRIVATAAGLLIAAVILAVTFLGRRPTL